MVTENSAAMARQSRKPATSVWQYPAPIDPVGVRGRQPGSKIGGQHRHCRLRVHQAAAMIRRHLAARHTRRGVIDGNTFLSLDYGSGWLAHQMRVPHNFANPD